MTPDPNNPQPGDQFIDADGDVATIIHVNSRWAWVEVDCLSDPGLWRLSTIATWTPVTPPPPDRWVVFTSAGGHYTSYAVREHADELAASIGGKVAHYTFAEWVTQETGEPT